MGIIDEFRGKEPESDEPIVEHNLGYRICTENNPDERKYRCSKNDVVSPDCKISLYLTGMTSEELATIELELLNLLERNNFRLR